MTFFITVLVNAALMGITPPQGWIQGNIPFQDKAQCEMMIPITEESIHMSIMQMTGNLGYVEKIECMTEQDWIDRNVEMGHEVPADLKMKTRPKEPEGT